MPDLGLAADAITYSSVISALAKGKQWAAALQVALMAMAAMQSASQALNPAADFSCLGQKQAHAALLVTIL